MKYISLFLILIFTGCSASAPEKPARISPPKIYLDIQKLINDTPDGRTVIVPYGEFILKKPLIVTDRKKLTISSLPGTRIFVDDVNEAVLRISGSEDITIQNLHLRHLNPLKEYECHGPVIRADAVKHLRVINCELDGCGAVGLSAWDTDVVEVRNCFIHHNTFNAFYFHKCGSVKIHSSIIENNKNFMQSYQTSDIEMSDNRIQNNGGYWKDKDPDPGLKKERN